MEIVITSLNNTAIAEIVADSVVINDMQDALDIMANCAYQGAQSIIIHEKNIVPAFFDLKTGIAGDVLQKFSNYNARLAIVGNFTKFTSKSLHDFIYESNKTGQINFVNTVDEAQEKLGK